MQSECLCWIACWENVDFGSQKRSLAKEWSEDGLLGMQLDNLSVRLLINDKWVPRWRVFAFTAAPYTAYWAKSKKWCYLTGLSWFRLWARFHGCCFTLIGWNAEGTVFVPLEDTSKAWFSFLNTVYIESPASQLSSWRVKMALKYSFLKAPAVSPEIK